MKIVIVTSDRFGIASIILPELCLNPQLKIIKVLTYKRNSPDRTKEFKRKLKKISRIGLLGTFNGIRLRKWYSFGSVKDLQVICNENNIQFSEMNYLNHVETIKIFKQTNSDLGLSLGNGYIPKKIFSIPKFGMINIHTELLPGFRGAADIIWPIYENIKETGFTIHQISSKIDMGDILYQKKYPIKFYASLGETVLKNRGEILPDIPRAFSHVCENYLDLLKNTSAQGNGNTYTTPTYSQFLQMQKNNLKTYQETKLKD